MSEDMYTAQLLKNFWSKEEDEILLDAIKKYGNSTLNVFNISFRSKEMECNF